jgi:hypothetical protein
MIQYQSHALEEETLDLASRSEVYCFGPEMVLRRCKITIRVPSKALIITRTRFIDCEIDCRSRLPDFFAPRLAEKYGADIAGLRTLLRGLPGVIW